MKYLVRVGSQLRYIHVDHLLETGETGDSVNTPMPQGPVSPMSYPAVELGPTTLPASEAPAPSLATSPSPGEKSAILAQPSPNPSSTPMKPPERRYPGRDRSAPKRLIQNM